MNINGKLLGFEKGVLSGWLYDLDRLQERLVIEIVADDIPVALVRAQVWLQELSDIGDGCYGFYQSIPSARLAGRQRLRARLANADCWLDGTIFLDDEDRKTTINSPLIGYVANRSGLQLYGWAWNPLVPNEAVSLQFFENNVLLGETVANQKMAELLELGVGSGSHGFEFTLPFEFADGKRREITVINRQGQALKYSPVAVQTYPQTINEYLQTLTGEHKPSLDLIGLLARQFQDYQGYLPVSVNFSSYPQWQRSFAGKASACGDGGKRFLIVVSGDGEVNPTLNSLLRQTYANFEVLLKSAATVISDPRIVSIDADAWEQTVRTAVQQHQGLLSFIDAGDSFDEGALARLQRAFADPNVQMVYSDCFCETELAALPGPWFKPDWDLDLFLTQPLAQHAFAVRAEVLAGNPSPWLTVPNAWPWLAVETLGDDESAIRHIAAILYRRCLANSRQNHDEIVEHFLPRIAPQARIERPLLNGLMRTLHWQQPENWPVVSLIIPTRDQKPLLEKCILSLQLTDYPALEIIVVNNDSQEAEALDYLAALPAKGIRVLDYPHRFNYAAINNFAVEHAQGAVIGLINNDIEAINADWLKLMVTQLLRPNVGAVGAKLLWPNGMVQHAGVLLGLHGLAGHVGNDWQENDLGYWGYNQLTRRMNAVTAACLICRKDDYLQLGGFDADQFPVAFNDVDFCLRLRASGKTIVWAAEARLWHAESASRGQDDLPAKRSRLEMEKSALYRLWGDKLYSDSSYNVNLNLDRYSHKGLAFPPRVSGDIE